MGKIGYDIVDGQYNLDFSKTDIVDPVTQQSIQEYVNSNVVFKEKYDFSETALATQKSESERSLIQNFLEDLDDLSGIQLHLRRTEIFQMTGKPEFYPNGTDTRGLLAIRQAIMKALDKANEGYREVNFNYTKAEQAFRSADKHLKKIDEDHFDIRSIKASDLARRLTSHASGEMREVIELMQSQIAQFPELYNYIDINNLQKAFNLFDKKFKLGAGTSLQSEVSKGTSQKGVSDILSKAVKGGIAGGLTSFGAIAGAGVGATLGVTGQAGILPDISSGIGAVIETLDKMLKDMGGKIVERGTPTSLSNTPSSLRPQPPVNTVRNATSNATTSTY
jgi:hypothetical protein